MSLMRETCFVEVLLSLLTHQNCILIYLLRLGSYYVLGGQ